MTDNMGFQPTNLEPQAAMTKLDQVDMLLSDFDHRMTSNAKELRALVEDKSASGQFVIKFAQRWTEHVEPMFQAWHRLCDNSEIARGVYQNKMHVNGN